MARKATSPVADLTESEAPETVIVVSPDSVARVRSGVPWCDHCHVEMQLGASGVYCCPSCYRVERSAQVAP